MKRNTSAGCLLVVMFLVLILGGCNEDRRNEEFSEIVKDIRAKYGVPALVVSLGHSDGEIKTAVDGVRVKGSTDLASVDDKFHIGSITKPLTATMIATLVQEGVIDWDTTIAESLPACAESMHDGYRDITLAQLLAHESGLPPFENDEDFEGLETEGTPRDQRLNFACTVLGLNPVVSPGNEYRYSNAGFTVAAAMAEAETDVAWETLMIDRVFSPLGLATAGFGWPGKDLEPAPWGHWNPRGGESRPQDPRGEYQIPVVIAPAGDVHVSTPDLAKFLIEHLKSLRSEPALISPQIAKTMHTRRIRSGLGWGVQELLGIDPVSVYQGSAGTFVTMVLIAPSEDLVIAVSTNDGTDAGAAATGEALKAILLWGTETDATSE